MKKSVKMNFLYKISFVLLMLCIPLFVVSIIVAYLLEQTYISIIFSAGGALLAFVGIILAMFSRPKELKDVDNTTHKQNLIEIEEDM